MSEFDEKSTVLDEVKDVANSAWGFFIFNRRMAIMLGLIILITGLFSYFLLPRESEPEVQVPYAVVITSYQGASPQEVAEQVTFKLEQKIKSVEDLENMESTSSEGISQIFVEFDAKADIDESIRNLRDRVDEAAVDLPEDAETPMVRELSFSDTPIVTFSFFGDLPYEQLLSVVEDIQDEFEKISGIQDAAIVGKRNTHILVSVDESAMLQYGLNLRAIGQAISIFHMNSPIGNIEVDDLVYRVRIAAEQEDVERIENIPITSVNGAIIYVKDVADVKEELQEAVSMSRVSTAGDPSKSAISMNIIKKTGANVIKTVDECRSVIERLEQENVIPEEVEHLAINDMSLYIREDFNRLMRNALQTIAIIFIILLFIFGIREALISAIAIPATFLITFTYLYQTGNTFNFIVLFSLILGLGLLVDVTIVMMEGIHEYVYTKKLSPINAALMAVKTYRYPLLSGMLTTIAAFVPMLMMSGMIGEFFKFIPLTVSVVLISSFFIGLFIIPAYAVVFMQKLEELMKELNANELIKELNIRDLGWKPLRWMKSTRKRIIAKINEKYQVSLEYFFAERKRRFSLYLISGLLFLSAAALPFVGLVKVEGFPMVDIDFMFIDVEAPVGTTLNKLDPITRKIEEVIQQDVNIGSYVLNMGMGGSVNLGGDLSPTAVNTHLATFSINFVDEDDRTAESFEIAEGYKNKLAFVTEADITVPELRSGPPVGATIQVHVFGDDYGILKEISDDIQLKLNEWGGQQVDDDMATGTAEFTFDFSDPYQKALLKNYGLSVMEVAQEARMAVYPTKVATIKRDDEEINVNIQQNWGDYRPLSIDDVKNIQIQNPLGQYVSLGNLATPAIGASLTSIKHFDGDQVITVSSDLSPGQVPADILNKLEPYLEDYQWPEGYSYEIAGGNEETNQSFKDLFYAMGLAILLIFLILIAQFNSFKQPFVILMTLPLSLIGVLYGFMVLGLHVGVGTMIGIVALSGIVINDAIVLIDRINNNRKDGMTIEEAIKEAGPARLQPIVITSVTTILGVLPISLTDPFWLTLGMAIVFGMAFSTILTLVIIPNLYYTFEIRAERKCLNR
ncbi:efflux RND transporter permease subunit [Patescibacteria group bacterium]|nr:efflux RND transporter permease subunit [Patescibacteria group bacterium]MBU1682490.1 efflux RND transporter permease subunit [Patescibacteria group bacterium]MBU1935276.1 efflux RND transporter permease subunit [Patescibacteria group bacterium]